MDIRNLAVNLLLITLTLIGHPALSADYALEKKYVVSLSGKITPGDAERLAAYFMTQRVINTIYLNSPGGDLNEALRIAELVKSGGVRVSVKSGSICASSCFFIFIAGTDRTAATAADDGSYPKKASKKFGYVGIHRPYFAKSDGDRSSAKQQEAMMAQAKSYLASRGVAQHLIDLMMSRPSNDIYWLSERDLEAIGPYDPGDEENLIRRCNYKRIAKIVEENWSDDQVNRLLECESDYWMESYGVKQLLLTEKLSKGWRPWKTKV